LNNADADFVDFAAIQIFAAMVAGNNRTGCLAKDDFDMAWHWAKMLHDARPKPEEDVNK
jgi:hypothetical protein